MYLEHPIFTSPPGNTTLWRYMDLERFKDLLTEQALFFARAAQFDDTLEGLVTEANVKLRETLAQPGIFQYLPDEMKEQVERDIDTELREWQSRVLVSCWHESCFENYDIWEKRGEQGIVIMTSYKSLKCSSEIYIGHVKYVDEGTLISETSIPSIPSIYLHKRKQFEWEREVRAITASTTSAAKVKTEGAYYEVDLAILVKKVFVTPLAKGRFFEYVQSVVRSHGPNASVCKSALGDEPS